MQEHPALAHQAMIDAEEAHQLQRRKYSNEPYIRHPAEVAGIAAGAWVASHQQEIALNVLLAVCWLHDVVEDGHRSIEWLKERYPQEVVDGVIFLTESKEGIRSTRKREHNERIALAPNWVKTIRAADMLANLRKLVAHAGAKDRAFVRLYLSEKRNLLKYLNGADQTILSAAHLALCSEEAFAAASL